MLKHVLAALALTMATDASAADLQIIAGGGFTGPMKELAAQFEKSSGHKLTIRFAATPDLIKIATSGEPFDLAVVPQELFADAAAKAQFEATPTIDIARVGLGVAVKAGAPKPDISSAAALKQTLLKAQSVAYLPQSAAGAQVTRSFERMGIAAEMKAKTKPQSSPAAIPQAVASGGAELGVFLINVLTAPGVDVVGPFPPELQQEIVYKAGVAAKSHEPAAARAFIDFLRTPAAKDVIRKQGLTPG
jgi:molybdate transport system substrate-binding protein